MGTTEVAGSIPADFQSLCPLRRRKKASGVIPGKGLQFMADDTRDIQLESCESEELLGK